MPEIADRKVRGSMWVLLKSFYLRRIRYTRRLLAYRWRKNRHSNGLGITRNEYERLSKSLEKYIQRGQTVNAEITSMKQLIERETIYDSKSRLEGRRKRTSKRSIKSKQSCEFCSPNLNQKNNDPPNPSQHCPDHRELEDVLEKIMNSNQTDPLLEIIRDPTSLLVTYMRTSRYFPKLMSKEKAEAITGKSAMVVFKPESKLLARSQSFLSHIKIRLKQAISLSKGHTCTEETNPKLNDAVENESDYNSDPRVSNIYLEAKKYLSETMKKDGDLDGSVCTAKFKQTLERILALSESNSSVSSPELQPRHSFGVTSTRWLSREGEFQTDVEREQIVEKDSIFLENLDDQEFLLNVEQGEESVATGDATNLEDHADTIEESSEINVVECIEQIEEESYDTQEAFSSPPPFFHLQKVENLDISIDSTEQPSPVSVLDSFFVDDGINSPERSRLSCSNPLTPIKFMNLLYSIFDYWVKVEHPIRRLEIKFEDENMSETTRDVFLATCKEDEEHIKNYVETVLRDFQLSDQFLDDSLFDEVDFPCTRAYYAKELIFDCTNEVLWEMYGVSTLNPRSVSISDRETVMHRIVKRVFWHLVPPPLPRTLHQVVEKDLSDAMIWMDLGLEIEGLVAEIGEVIIEELIAETIFCSTTREALIEA